MLSSERVWLLLKPLIGYSMVGAVFLITGSDSDVKCARMLSLTDSGKEMFILPSTATSLIC